ncbi:MAG: hypothetical protein JW900_09210 [Anaerolineae bacterium]|nr:hypothetical protein [Anaerolineae bacterium]
MSEKREILELIEAGEISVEEGVRRLEMLAGGPQPEPEAPHVSPPPSRQQVVRPGLVRLIWQLAFWLGVVLLTGGALLVAAVYAWDLASGWLVCGWPLFAVGVLVMVLGWWMRRARWLSLRVRQTDGPNIILALPLPLGLVGWAVRILRPFVPQLQQDGLDEMILALQEELHDGHPLIVEVDEGEGGEQVQVYLG